MGKKWEKNGKKLATRKNVGGEEGEERKRDLLEYTHCANAPVESVKHPSFWSMDKQESVASAHADTFCEFCLVMLYRSKHISQPIKL